MTREEAIKNIKEHCYFANLIPQAKEALDMAIKVLEQEPMLDNIRTEISKSKTEHEMQLAERDTKGKLLISDIYCDIINILDKYKTESEGE